MASRNLYTVKLTGSQLRVLHELTSMVLNSPDVWGDDFPGHDWRLLVTASNKITTTLHEARQEDGYDGKS